MIKLLFVCHGNICRSPLAEFVMKDLVRRAGLESEFEIASAATSNDEIGNPVYPNSRRLLESHGISCAGKTARRMTAADYDKWDHIIGMDDENMDGMLRITGGRREKLSLLLDYTDRPGQVADPWYTRDFDATWRDVNDGCRGLLQYLTKGAGK